MVFCLRFTFIGVLQKIAKLQKNSFKDCCFILQSTDLINFWTKLLQVRLSLARLPLRKTFLQDVNVITISQKLVLAGVALSDNLGAGRYQEGQQTKRF